MIDHFLPHGRFKFKHVAFKVINSDEIYTVLHFDSDGET